MGSKPRSPGNTVLSEKSEVFGDRLQESLHNIPSLHLLQKSIDRTPNPATPAPQDVRVNVVVRRPDAPPLLNQIRISGHRIPYK